MRKAFTFRLYPNKEQEQKLFFTLNRCREVYNAALSERKDSYKKHFRQTVYRIAQMEANMIKHTWVGKQPTQAPTGTFRCEECVEAPTWNAWGTSQKEMIHVRTTRQN